MKQLLLFRK